MERIGRAASKMAHGNLVSYNFFVIGISCLISLFVFFASGFSVLAAIFLISLILRPLMPGAFESGHYTHLIKICLVVLASIISLLNIWAIFKNIKFRK